MATSKKTTKKAPAKSKAAPKKEVVQETAFTEVTEAYVYQDGQVVKTFRKSEFGPNFKMKAVRYAQNYGGEVK